MRLDWKIADAALLVRLDEAHRAALGFQTWLYAFMFNIFVEKLAGVNVRD
jgi:hypothetical protein